MYGYEVNFYGCNITEDIKNYDFKCFLRLWQGTAASITSNTEPLTRHRENSLGCRVPFAGRQIARFTRVEDANCAAFVLALAVNSLQRNGTGFGDSLDVFGVACGTEGIAELFFIILSLIGCLSLNVRLRYFADFVHA
ncbi:MAG: hypothetical protein IPG14_19030 [Dehalococcoidia bacterium]|nr:hypothetical protein [Dehalococcoidia bacterium]